MVSWAPESRPDPQRVIAGISCEGVLSLLGGYVDGTLPAEVVESVEAHLAGCDYCERFGGGYSEMVKTLRDRLARPAALPNEVSERLRAKIEEVAGG